MKLDYTLQTSEERIAYVNRVLEAIPRKKLTSKYLSYMGDYILFLSDKNQTKKERKEDHPITTRNREITINKRQTSFEELVAGFENGEDGLYALINNDKNQIMDHKDPISKKDVENSPQLKQALKTIESLQKQFDVATGPRKFSLKRQIIETWQQVYILKASLKNAPSRSKTSSQIKTMVRMRLDENITFDKDGCPQSDCPINLFTPTSISFLLCYYSQLKQECAEDFQSDMYHLLLDLEDLVDRTLLEKYEILYDLVIWKIDGLTNEEIQKKMAAHHGITHNEQYYSTLWRKRIPKMIAEQAQKEWLVWYYTNQEYGKWKKCGKCGEIKLAHSMFYSKNTSKDGYYSICKECRSKKAKGII